MMMLNEPFVSPFDTIDSLFAGPSVPRRRRRHRGGGSGGSFSISAEIVESATEYSVFLELPGVPKENIDISMENNNLTIKFEKLHQIPDQNILNSDFAYGQHIRRFKLPLSVNQDSAQTSFKDGILCITFVKPITISAPKKLVIQG